MVEILQMAGPIFGLVGFIAFARALFMPKRYHAKRPRWMFAGLACIVIGFLSIWVGYGGMEDAVTGSGAAQSSAWSGQTVEAGA